MRHIVFEGLPAAGKSELLELLARFYPESVRVLPELVKEIVTEQQLDLFKDRDRLTEALRLALPLRREAVDRVLSQGKICLEESHMGVHLAYARALGDDAFIAAYEELKSDVADPDAYIRLETPVSTSMIRQEARGTKAFDIDRPTLTCMLQTLDRWHKDRGSRLIRIDADRPAAEVVADTEAELRLAYAVSPDLLAHTFDVLLLLGRPAGGKSEFIDCFTHLEAGERARTYHLAPLEIIDDFPLLWRKFEEDDLWERQGRPRLHSKRCNGNYAVTDPGMWRFLIERINQEAERAFPSQEAFARRTLIIEFSRGGPHGYADALAALSPAILQRAAILYISVSFEESWRRNIARYDEANKSGILTHSVPREEMESTYGVDDWHSLTDGPLGWIDVNGLRVPYATMGNEPELTDPKALAARYRSALQPLHDLSMRDTS